MCEQNKTPFGVLPDGRGVEQITLSDGPLSCQILTYGGALRGLTVPDREGQFVDVVLGLDTLEDYLAQDKYLGALIGRYANRIGGSRFSLEGIEYPLRANDGSNHLHGGPEGFDKQLWQIKSLTGSSLCLTLTSPDGFAMADALRERGIYPEMADRGHVVCICTCADGPQELARLEEGLEGTGGLGPCAPTPPPPEVPEAGGSGGLRGGDRGLPDRALPPRRARDRPGGAD